MPRPWTGLLALLLPLTACDGEPGTVTMRSVKMREVGGVVVLTGTLEVADVTMLAIDGTDLEVEPHLQERSGGLDESRPPAPPTPNHADCGLCTCDLASWTCDCTQCEGRADPEL